MTTSAEPTAAATASLVAGVSASSFSSGGEAGEGSVAGEAIIDIRPGKLCSAAAERFAAASNA
jgi:hypothetical protein